MKNWFKPKKYFQNRAKKSSKTLLKPLNYPAKIILAWAKAVEGNKEIQTWLTQNGYEELTIACWAIHLKDDARNWLMDNGFPHLLAMINAGEGNPQAQEWLLKHNFTLFYYMALAIDDESVGIEWIRKNTTPDIFLLTQAIKNVKDQIEDNHNDIHKFATD